LSSMQIKQMRCSRLALITDTGRSNRLLVFAAWIACMSA
jgi:hypothetical protein